MCQALPQSLRTSYSTDPTNCAWLISEFFALKSWLLGVKKNAQESPPYIALGWLRERLLMGNSVVPSKDRNYSWQSQQANWFRQIKS